MTREYQVADHRDSRKLAEFLSKEGQLLLPMLDLISQAELAVDELIDVAGRAAIEAVLLMSAQEVAGRKHPGKAGGACRSTSPAVATSRSSVSSRGPASGRSTPTTRRSTAAPSAGRHRSRNTRWPLLMVA